MQDQPNPQESGVTQVTLTRKQRDVLFDAVWMAFSPPVCDIDWLDDFVALVDRYEVELELARQLAGDQDSYRVVMPTADFSKAVGTAIGWHDYLLADLRDQPHRALTGPAAAYWAANPDAWEEHLEGRRVGIDRNLEDRKVLTDVVEGSTPRGERS